MRQFIAILVLAVIFGSCNSTNEIIENGPFELRFSQDTVLFDTLFTTVKSITKRFRVYNDGEKARSLSSIRIAGGESSAFTLILNGINGSEFSEQVILGGDSLMLLVEANIDIQNRDNPLIVEDSVLFESTVPVGGVKLLAWGQDANYLRDSVITCDAVWDSPKPYVLLGSVLVDSLCSLRITEGVQIYSAFNTRFFVGGTLEVQGTPEKRVLFRNDRLDDGFRDAPGQWEGIFFLEGSKGSFIDFASIVNSRYGIWLGTPDNDTIADLTLSNTEIFNVSRTGLIAFTSDLVVENCIIHNCAEQVIANLAGGNYSYNHCTLVNYPFQFFREEPLAVFSDNIELADGSLIAQDISVTIRNSIIEGSLADELVFNNGAGAEFILGIGHSMLRTQSANLDVNNNIINADPQFVEAEEGNYRLMPNSAAVDAGITTQLTTDLEGNPRDANPDIGAYEVQN